MNRFRLIMFDCDGTLVDSQHLIVDAMSKAYADCGLDQPDPWAVRHIIGLSLEDAIMQLLPQQPQSLHSEIAKNFRKHFLHMRTEPDHEEPLYEGAYEAIKALHETGMLLGIATGKAMRGLLHTLERHGLSEYFLTLQTADHNPSKPHPAMLQSAMAEMNVSPSEIVMIGDAPFDMAMAQAAGCAAIGVGWSDHGEDVLRAAGATGILSHYRHLITELNRLKIS